MQKGLYQLLKSIFDCIYSQDLRYDQTMDQISMKKNKTKQNKTKQNKTKQNKKNKNKNKQKKKPGGTCIWSWNLSS